MAHKVLIVDDEPLMHMLYKTHLEKAGYHLLTAKDGAEVLELATREAPQLVVMDVMMREVDGLQALRELKKHATTKDIPVIIITGQGSAHHALRQEAENCGAALFLTKPFSPAQLLGALQKVLPAPGAPGAATASQQ